MLMSYVSYVDTHSVSYQCCLESYLLSLSVILHNITKEYLCYNTQGLPFMLGEKDCQS